MPIFGFCAGDDARENGDFEREKPRLQGSKIFNGGDVDENRHFIEGKVVAHYQKLTILNGGDVHENRHLIERKLVAHYQKLNILLKFLIEIVKYQFEFFLNISFIQFHC